MDYFNTYVSTPRAPSIRLFATLVVLGNIMPDHLDTQQGVLESSLEEVYMNLPPGCGDFIGRLAGREVFCRSQLGLQWAAQAVD